MTCLSNNELEELYHGNVDKETSQNMFSHIAICNNCLKSYTLIAEMNMSDHIVDVSASVMKQIKKSPLSRGKILAIYTVAAACAFIIMTTGSIDKMTVFTHHLENQATQWSEKINSSNLNHYWEGFTHGIQN